MKKRIDWISATHLLIGSLLCLLAVVLAKTIPRLPVWGWSLIGISGIVLVFTELPKVGQSKQCKA